MRSSHGNGGIGPPSFSSQFSTSCRPPCRRGIWQAHHCGFFCHSPGTGSYLLLLTAVVAQERTTSVHHRVFASITEMLILRSRALVQVRHRGFCGRKPLWLSRMTLEVFHGGALRALTTTCVDGLVVALRTCCSHVATSSLSRSISGLLADRTLPVRLTADHRFVAFTTHRYCGAFGDLSFIRNQLGSTPSTELITRLHYVAPTRIGAHHWGFIHAQNLQDIDKSVKTC